MTTLASEDFAGSGALNASNWTQTLFSGTGTSSRVSGQLSSPTTVAEFYRWAALTWPNDQMAHMTYVSGSDAADQGTGPAVRLDTGGAVTGYLLQVGATDTRLYEVAAGVFTQLGTTNSVAPTNGDVFEISAVGTSITAKKNGSAICGSPITNAAHAGGQAGFWAASSAAATIRDDWAGADSAGFGVADQPPQSECGDNWEATSLAEIEGTDLGPWDWYQDNTVANRAGVEPPIPECLPNAFEWIDPNETDEALYIFPWGTGPPPADVDTYVYDQTIHDSSNQLEDVDEDFAFAQAPLAADAAPDQIWPEDASTQLEDVDEDFGFAEAPRPADVASDLVWQEDSDAQWDDEPEDFAFADAPLPDDVVDQLFNEFGHFDDPTDEPVDVGWFDAPFDVPAEALPQCEDADAQIDEPDEDFAFSADPLPADVVESPIQGEDSDAQIDDVDEDFAFFDAPLAADVAIDLPAAAELAQPDDEPDTTDGFADAPLAADNDVSAPAICPDQADEPEDEAFGFDVPPQPEDVQSDQVFTECGDWWPDDVVEEPEGFSNDPAVPELVIEEPLPFCDFPAQAEEPEDEDFGTVDFQTPDDVIAPDVVAGGTDGAKYPRRRKPPRYYAEDDETPVAGAEAPQVREPGRAPEGSNADTVATTTPPQPEFKPLPADTYEPPSPIFVEPPPAVPDLEALAAAEALLAEALRIEQEEEDQAAMLAAELLLLG